MDNPLRLMAVLAHPDDESLGFGGALARYSAEGVDVSLVVATRGERGWRGLPEDDPGLEAVGRIREKEVCAAADVLGVRQVEFLDLIDGDMDRADHAAAARRIAALIREHRPQVVLTFDPRGAYGHPDHIAVSQFTLAAIVLASNPSAAQVPGAPFAVSKFYYRVWNREENGLYGAVFGQPALEVDGVVRGNAPWEDWAVTTRIDASGHWRTVWEAVRQHGSQIGEVEKLAEVSDERKKAIFGCEGYYRAFSTVNGGREREDDLFAGLR